jgi:transcriptional regulator with XRE-family HTH domain
MTQKEAAAGLGIGYRAYQCYELNQRYPDIHGLVNIANFFDASLDYLVGLSDVRERQ